MRRAIARVLAVMLVLGAFVGTSQAATVVQLESDPGDPLGGGQNQTLTPGATLTMAVNVDGNSIVTVDLTSSAPLYTLHFSFAPRQGTALVGSAQVMRVNPPGTQYPVITVTASGVLCATDEGMFYVYELAGGPGAVTQLAVDFQQRCRGSTGLLRGQIRFNSSVPLARSVPLAVIATDNYVDQGDTVTLDGTWSLAGTSPVASYAWQQVSGPAVSLNNAASAAPTFVAGADAGAVSALAFNLTVTDGQGNTGTAQQIVNVYSTTTPRTVVALQSDPGEYVLGGASYKFRDTDTTISEMFTGGSGDNALQIDAGVTLTVQSALSLPLQVGNYLHAIRLGDTSPNYPGLDLSGFSRGCNDSLGQFSIYEIAYDPTTLKLNKLALDFDRRCTSNPDSPARAYGQVRINSAVPLVRNIPNAIAGDSQEVTEQTTVQLDGSSSRPGKNPIAGYNWQQTAGPSVTLSSASAVAPTFAAPAVASGSVELDFTLTVTDTLGNSATDQVKVTVVSASTPRNELLINSSPNDYIGQGEQTTLDENDSLMSVTRASPASVTLNVTSGTAGLDMTFAAPAGQSLKVGNYDGAQRATFAAPPRPGLEIGAVGRACNILTGRFVIREIAFDSTGVLLRLAADAVQYCEAGTAPLTIAVRYQSSVALITAAPTADAGTGQDVLERAAITLDGRNTLPGTGQISAWQWKQVAGSPVALTGANTSVAHFVAPVVTATTTLSFQLQATSTNGTQNSDQTDIRVHKKTEPRSFATLSSAVGDYIGAGQGDYFLSPADGLFFAPAIPVPNRDSVHLSYNGGPEQWTFEIVSTGTPLALGSYNIDGTHIPVLSIAHDGSACDTTHGSIKILDIGYSNDILQRVAFDFVQYCDASTGPLQGQVRFNTALPDANAGGDQTVASGAQLTLSGSASVPAVGTLQGYAWKQLSGPAASIKNEDTAMVLVTAPAVSAGSTNASLVFQLTVTDDRGLTDTDTMALTVTPGAAAPPPTAGGGGGGAASLLELLCGFGVLALRLARRVRPR